MVINFDSNHRSAIANQIARAARELDLFQVVNQGIHPAILDRTIAAVKAFLEQPPEIRSRFCRRDTGKTSISYHSNYDLYQSEAAMWRDTLTVRLSPTPPAPEDVPEMCRDAAAEWDQEPDQTMGLASHTDQKVLNVLLQHQLGGLQIEFHGLWVDVKPIHGALVINIGDLIQVN
ncbi:Oxoglutarate/iron-dependent dioxygenase [Parasponia andersonii]|uniref:Oxoglutarate/iron-dependent dioxygenase n=1 Tax=Parasponia andersonii TaxID=3476 RepID=A0A2P5DAJ2_PARAD|nr:Oxoglutarate/iron-dependent dioxygenase [Parasponia andersonii]